MVRTSGQDTEKGSAVRPNAPWYVKLLVILHVICIVVWTMPAAKEDQMSGKVSPPIYALGDQIRLFNSRYLKSLPPLSGYLYLTGTWQYWDMFSPNPAQIDYWCDADIIYRDGSKKHFLYPRMYLLPIPNKYAQERYRKYYERATLEANPFLWPQFAERIAYVNDDAKNPPVTVRLTRHWFQVMAPGRPQPKQYNRYMYYEYAVDQRLLARMRAGTL